MQEKVISDVFTTMPIVMVKFTFTTKELTSPAQMPEAHHHKFVVAKLGSSKTDIFLKKVASFERFFY